jgi:hypothetical protein
MADFKSYAQYEDGLTRCAVAGKPPGDCKCEYNQDGKGKCFYYNQFVESCECCAAQIEAYKKGASSTYGPISVLWGV